MVRRSFFTSYPFWWFLAISIPVLDRLCVNTCSRPVQNHQNYIKWVFSSYLCFGMCPWHSGHLLRICIQTHDLNIINLGYFIIYAQFQVILMACKHANPLNKGPVASCDIVLDPKLMILRISYNFDHVCTRMVNQRYGHTKNMVIFIHKCAISSMGWHVLCIYTLKV